MWTRRVASAVLVTSTCSLASCVLYEPAVSELFTDQALAFITIGETTKEEVEREVVQQAQRNIGKKANSRIVRQKYRNGDWWLYTHKRWTSGLMVASGNEYRQFLVVKFDRQGFVSEYERSKTSTWTEIRGCTPEDVCFGQFESTLLATKEEDRTVKEFEVPTGRCGIYVYSGPGISDLSISIDDSPIGTLVNEQHYYFRDLEPGSHDIAGAFIVPSTGISPATFNCASGEKRFFFFRKASHFTSRRVELEPHDEITGRDQVARRRLTLISSKREEIY